MAAEGKIGFLEVRKVLLKGSIRVTIRDTIRI